MRMKLNRLLGATLTAILATALLRVGATAEEVALNAWKTVDAKGHFSFSVPADMEERAVQGTDSYVGEFHNNNIHLSFDYGWWSDPLEDTSRPQYQEAIVEIDGKRAKQVTFFLPKPEEAPPFVAAVHFSDVGDGPDKGGGTTRLTMFARCRSPADQETAKRIFSSIRFR